MVGRLVSSRRSTGLTLALERPGFLKELARRGAVRVPEITAYFWVIKALSTAMGESTSD